MKVRARFAFYPHGEPSYFVTGSNHPEIPLGGNVGGDQLLSAGVPIPLTPALKTWEGQVDRKEHCGRCYRRLRGTWSDFVWHMKVVHEMKDAA